MMLNKTSAHFYTLGNNIYIRKSSSTNIYLLKVNNTSASKLTVKTPERLSIVFAVTFGHTSYIFLVFLLLALNKLMFAEPLPINL